MALHTAVFALACCCSSSDAFRLQTTRGQVPGNSYKQRQDSEKRRFGTSNPLLSFSKFLLAQNGAAAFNLCGPGRPTLGSSQSQGPAVLATIQSYIPTARVTPCLPNRGLVEMASEFSAKLPAMLKRVSDHQGEVIVVKYGGHAMTNDERANEFASDISLLQSLGLRPVVVHGGGPQINEMLSRLEVESTFVKGLRVTSPAVMEVVEMVLCGKLNKKISAAINAAGGRAVGLSGKDDALVTARQKDPELGLVGTIDTVHVSLLELLLDEGIVPVIAPVATGNDGTSFNVNADTMAGAIASALGASNLLLLTDVEGVLDGPGGNLIPQLTPSGAKKLTDDGVATGGMIPKLGTAIDAVESGCTTAVIMDGRVPHCTLEFLFGETPVGTAVSEDKQEDLKEH